MESATITKVTLRQEKLRSGKLSLYLDFYPPIWNPHIKKMSRREFLGLYLFGNPKNKFELDYNECIEKARISDIKYHYILMHGGVGTEGLDSIESWFRDPERVKHIESEVKAYEDRVQETARALDQKQRLEEKINELNSQNTNKNSRK